MDTTLRLEQNHGRESALKDASWLSTSRTRNFDFDLIAGFVHDLVIGRYAKQSWIGFRTVDVLQAHRGFTRTRVGVFRQHGYLQFRRVPILRDTHQRPVVTHRSNWKRCRRLFSFDHHALDDLVAERFIDVHRPIHLSRRRANCLPRRGRSCPLGDRASCLGITNWPIALFRGREPMGNMIVRIKYVARATHGIGNLDDHHIFGIAAHAHEHGALSAGSPLRIANQFAYSRFLGDVCSIRQCLRAVGNFFGGIRRACDWLPVKKRRMQPHCHSRMLGIRRLHTSRNSSGFLLSCLLCVASTSAKKQCRGSESNLMRSVHDLPLFLLMGWRG